MSLIETIIEHAHPVVVCFFPLTEYEVLDYDFLSFIYDKHWARTPCESSRAKPRVLELLDSWLIATRTLSKVADGLFVPFDRLPSSRLFFDYFC